MNTFLRKLITPVAVFAASLGVALAMTGQREVVGAEAAEEAVYHSTSFNTAEGFTTSITYNEPREDQGTSPYLWDFLNGTVSTSNAITSPSAHLRGYDGAQTPSLETAFAIPDITKVVFSYKSDTNISVNLSYSTDNRETWPTVTNFARVSSATQVTYTINAAGLAGSANLRWQMLNGGTATGDSAELIIDDITIYYMSSTPVVTGISLKTAGTQLFTLGQTFNTSDLVITATKNNSTVEDVSAGLTVTGVNTMVLGQQTATVEYEGFTTTYQVNVTNNGASVGESSFATDLFISEYIEGSSNNKAVEIFNGTGSTVDLSNYSVKLFANGSLTPTSTQAFTIETLENGAVISLVNSSATNSFKKGTFITSTVANFNGDDAIALYKGETLIDVIGVIGEDPGKQWDGTAANGDASTLDKTLVRINTVISPNNTFTWSEWNVSSVDTSTNVGLHDFISADVTILEQATAFADYVLTGKGLDAKGECEAVLAALQIEFDFMVEDAQLEFQTNTDALFVNARARMAYLTAWVAANTPSSGRIDAPITSNTTVMSTLIIGIIGISSLLGYYFVNKKTKFQ